MKTKMVVRIIVIAVVVAAAVAALAIFLANSAKGFNDVKSGEYYFDAVNWARQNGITMGTTDTTFDPNGSCTRGQIITFIWRFFGKPGSSASNNPFVDVSEEDYFCEAVLWAVSRGITRGTAENVFSPDEPCTRSQIVTFLWRSADEPGTKKTDNPFKDVKDSDYFFKAVLWAVSNRITVGTANDAFSPNDVCTRGQVVTFLHRARGLLEGAPQDSDQSEESSQIVNTDDSSDTEESTEPIDSSGLAESTGPEESTEPEESTGHEESGGSGETADTEESSGSEETTGPDETTDPNQGTWIH